MLFLGTGAGADAEVRWTTMTRRETYEGHYARGTPYYIVLRYKHVDAGSRALIPALF
jgi:hypothetical protein